MIVTGRQIRNWEIEHETMAETAKKNCKHPKWTRTEYIAHKITCLMRSSFNLNFRRNQNRDT
jgi:hypothetical protein